MSIIDIESIKEILNDIDKLWVKTDYVACKEKCNYLSDLLSCDDFIGDDIIIFKSDLNRYIGNLNYIEGNYAKALDYYLCSLELAEKVGNKVLIANVANNIGSMYKLLSEFSKALYFYEKSMSLRKELKDYKNQYLCLNNLANLYATMALNGYDEDSKPLDTLEKSNYQMIAFVYLLLSYKIINLYNIPENMRTSTYNNLAALYLDMKEVDKAFFEYKTALDISEKYDLKKSNIYALLGISDCYKFKENYAESKEYLLKAETLAKKIQAKDRLRDIYRAIAEIYILEKKFDSACSFLKLFSDIQFEIFNEEFKNKLASIEAKFEIERKEQELEISRLKNIELAQANEKINKQKNELEVLNKNLNEFLGMVVHDLKNPISGVLSLCELSEYQLKKDKSDISVLEQNLNLIKSQSEKMYKMVNDLLDISAIESGKIRINLKKGSFKELFDEREFYYNHLAEKKKIDFILNRDFIDTTILFDKDRIIEVVDNLITNAIKFTNPNGYIKVGFNICNNNLQVYIQDTGQGFKPEELKLVFKEFRKYTARPTAGETSTGFGLMIVKKIIDLHNGSVYLKSEAGKGSTFTFELKLYHD